MESTIKKYWITALGMLFLFLAFLYFLKMAIDQNWIPPLVRAMAGIVAGTACMFGGYLLFRKEKKISAEVIAGFGISLVFATFAYTSFSSAIHWSVNSLFISVLALSGIATWVSYRFNLRILMFISIFGGLMAPVVLKAGETQIMSLFLYLTIVNIASIAISTSKNWNEIRVMSFIITVINYTTYYVLFNPASWGKPFFYISSFFVVYMAGFLVASFVQKDRFLGLNLFMGVLNAINYVFWSVFIFNSFDISYAYATIIAGGLYLLIGALIYFLSGKSIVPSIIYFGMGVILLAISGGEMKSFSANGLNYAMSSAIWLSLCGLLFVTSIFTKREELKYISIGSWVILLIYWLCVAWDVKWVNWFGVSYIPFINPGALIWIALAFMGFVYSIAIEKRNPGISLTFGLISHVITGGLFTIQISNAWDAYSISVVSVNLAMSVSWAIYALSIFIWGAYKRNIIFRIFGSIVIIVTALKVFIFDLSGDSSIYKVICLAILGVTIVFIGFINQRWSQKENTNVKISDTL